MKDQDKRILKRSLSISSAIYTYQIHCSICNSKESLTIDRVATTHSRVADNSEYERYLLSEKLISNGWTIVNNLPICPKCKGIEEHI